MTDIAPCTAQLAQLIKPDVSQMLEAYDPDKIVDLATSETSRNTFVQEVFSWIRRLPRASEIRKHLHEISRHTSVQLSALREAVKYLVDETFESVQPARRLAIVA